MNLSEWIVSELEAHDVTDVFGIPGVDNLALYRELTNASGIRSVVVRNETTAAFAADAYHRVSRRVAACVTTGGPGKAYSAVGMGESRSASSTFVHLATAPNEKERESRRVRGVAHWFDGQDCFAPLTARTSRAHSTQDAQRVIQEALLLAQSGHAVGPVAVDIAKDLLSLDVEPSSLANGGAGEAHTPAVDVVSARQAFARVSQARSCVIWCGSGSLGSESRVLNLAEQIGAPVLLSFGAKRNFEGADHELLVRFPVHELEVRELLEQADCVLILGSDVDAMNLPEGVRLRDAVAVTREPNDLAHVPATAVVRGDVGEVLDIWLENTAQVSDAAGAAPDVVTLNDAIERRLRESPAGRGLEFLRMLGDVLPSDANVVCDMAIVGYWAAGYLSIASHRRLVYPGWGTLGFGLGAAVGAACARPDHRTVLLTGDSGFQYLIGDLGTVVENELPITIIVVDDGGYGMLRRAESELFDEHFAVDVQGPEPHAMALAFGIPVDVHDLFSADVPASLTAAFAQGGPNIVWLRGQLPPPAMAMLFRDN